LNGSDVGKLVRAVSVEVEADARRLVMSFDMDSSWHRPFVGKFQGNRHAYHIIRFGHRLRMLLPPETPCEHWGSQLHILHRGMQTVSASRRAVRLFLKAAELECAGHPRDEAVVAALAEFHVGELQRDPQEKSSRRSKQEEDLQRKEKEHQIIDTSILTKALLEDETRASFKSSCEPDRMDPVVRDHLKMSFERDWSHNVNRDAQELKAIRKLPMTTHNMKDFSNEALRNRLVTWLKSDAGREWSETRKGIYEDDLDVNA
jgi:hypothetical protein